MNEHEDRQSILIVDDDEVLQKRLVRAFADRGFDARGAGGFDEAVRLAEADPPELCVVDLRMPGRGGLELLTELKRIEPHTEVVVLTGYGSIATAIDAVRLGAVYFLPKPADADDILAAFDRGRAPPSTDSGEVAAPSLARAEWEHIQRILTDTGGNISETARRLGIHRRSLQRKLHKLPPWK
ncbi:MAG: response regulator [Polyangiaceae bacterium]|nr:response regulator [Polyangiaceae bacterium]MCE7891080.1 response regulator [Sorangiineae bacterium PRO1]MCL4750598.1 response regulator [Myxococcales bacterium]